MLPVMETVCCYCGGNSCSLLQETGAAVIAGTLNPGPTARQFALEGAQPGTNPQPASIEAIGRTAFVNNPGDGLCTGIIDIGGGPGYLVDGLVGSQIPSSFAFKVPWHVPAHRPQ